MKKIAIITLIFLLVSMPSFTQNIGINNTGATADASALLDLNSNNKGFLITRADTANITSPAFGLMTLAPLDSCLYMYSGVKWIGLGGAGTNCSCNCAAASPPPIFPCGGTVILIVDVTTATGKTWMDRNLGASQVATSSTDAAAYGDLYQWGRCSDGHEKRTSGTTATLSPTDTPGHSNFITTSGVLPDDWRSPQNNSLWQGLSGINNPCPIGYRIPTDIELDAERLTWATNDVAGAFASPLKLTAGGVRDVNGTILSVGSAGNYWSSGNINAPLSKELNIYCCGAGVSGSSRARGLSVRCIKN